MAHGKLVPVVWAMGAQLRGRRWPVQLAWASTVTSEAVVMCGGEDVGAVAGVAGERLALVASPVTGLSVESK